MNYDAIIIGTGQAGPSLARRLAGSGMKVAIIERDRFGALLQPIEMFVEEDKDIVMQPQSSVWYWGKRVPRGGSRRRPCLPWECSSGRGGHPGW